MIEAHADEIGLMVKHVDEKGFLRFIRIGGWFDQTLLTKEWSFIPDQGLSQASSAASLPM